VIHVAPGSPHAFEQNAGAPAVVPVLDLELDASRVIHTAGN